MANRTTPPPRAIIETLLAFAPLVIYRSDLRTYSAVYISPNVDSILGYAPAEVVGVPRWWVDALHPEDREGTLEGLRQAMAGREPTRQSEYRLRHRNGGYRWFRSTTRLTYDDEGGCLSTGYLLDITEQKTAEEALRSSEEYFRSLIENGSEIIHVVNADGTIRYASPSSERVLGYRPEERVGGHIDDFVHPEDLPRAAAEFGRRFRTPRGTASVEVRVRHADGTWRVLQATATNLLHDPAIAGIVINSRDITDRRATEEALRGREDELRHAQKMEAVGRLASGVAHDFNNLLTVISGYAQFLLGRPGGDAQAVRYAEGIATAARQGAALVDRLLEFGRKRPVQPVVLDLNALVREQEPLLHRLVGEAIELRTELDPALGPVRADPGQMKQVIMNLAANARDAMAAGGHLTLQTRDVLLPGDARDEGAGPYAVLVVSDTGQGMDRATQERIFDPFFTTKERGTGLGLSTVYGIVQQSGGRISVESQPGIGTMLAIYLPRVEDPAPEAPAEEPPLADLRPGTETVLVVEDREDVRLLIREVLELNGYTVLEAEAGEAALRLADRYAEPIHLLVTDVAMPKMGGPELATRLRPLRPGLRVLFVSGYAEGPFDEWRSDQPGSGFLHKPFTIRSLVRKVREVLDAPAPD